MGEARGLLLIGRVKDKDQVHLVGHLVAGCGGVLLTFDLDGEGLLARALVVVREQTVDSGVGVVLTCGVLNSLLSSLTGSRRGKTVN